MRNLLNAIALMLIALAITSQRDLDGNLLINGWMGLALTDFIVLGLAFFHLGEAFAELRR